MNARLIYVAGYGRSGSTLLDRQIAHSAAVFSAGELARLFGNAQQPGALGSCSCGARYAACPCWGPLLERLLSDPQGGSLARLEATTRRVETRDPATMPDGHPELERYRWLWRTVLEHMAVYSSRPVVVDSSKTTPNGSAYRPLLLARLTGSPVLMIHLLRDPAAVLHSASKGSNKALERGDQPGWVQRHMGVLRAYVSWRGANERALWLGGQPGIRRVVQTYDAFCADPDAFRRMVDGAARDLWGVGLPAAAEGTRTSELDHGVGGNRMRRADTRRIAADESWRSEASLITRALGAVHRALWPRFVTG